MDGVRHEELLVVVQGDRPKSADRRKLSFLKTHFITPAAIQGLPFTVPGGSRIDRILRQVRAESDECHHRAPKIVRSVPPNVTHKFPAVADVAMGLPDFGDDPG